MPAAGPAEVPLTSLSHGAGCACKIGAADLGPLLAGLPAQTDPDLLVDGRTRDDAAVYRLREDLAIVMTADFFTPIVDDPYEFGRIAAANALSDVYAMGAEPVIAVNLLAFSLERLGSAALERILRGGAEIVATAGAALGGGHSIDDLEPKYGMAVTGTVDPARMLTNAGGRPGDRLVLTKPLGGGLISTATKRGLASPELVAAGIGTMVELNAGASRSALAAGARAATDVTGFGLLGHLHELCLASGLAAELDAASVPAIDGALELARDPSCVAGGSRRNAEHAASFTRFDERVPAERRVLLSDAMTSGGLLVAVPEEGAAEVPGARVGALVAGEPGRIEVR